MGQLLGAFQDTGCHSESRSVQLAFWDLLGVWGRGTVLNAQSVMHGPESPQTPADP